MLANYHTHTIRCHHAEGTEREYIESAIAQGLQILGFSDHTPQPFPEGFHSGIRMDMSEREDYTSTLVKLREEYKDRIQILIGYEVEYSKKYFPTLLKLLKEYPLDYLIQGQHNAPNEVDGFYAGFETDSEEDLSCYVDTTIEGMETGCFLYLAHPDLIHYTGADATYKKHISRLIDASIDLQIPLEINGLGFREGRHYPCDRFFSLASQKGASFIFGCDAHHPNHVMKPEAIPGLPEFLAKYHIEIGDNILPLKPL